MTDIYDRQIKVFGERAQKRLGNSLVLVLGCGALGNLVANNLTRAGVDLRIVDRDLVESSNLHRTLFRLEDEGRSKVEALDEILSKGSISDIEPVFEDFNRFTWKTITKDVDLIVDCLDSMSSRYLLNEVSVKQEIPFIHGSAIRGEGRIKFFDGKNECFMCLYPRVPEPGSLETCRGSGVLNYTTSVVSSIQSSMALNYLADFGVVNRDLVVVDLKEGRFKTIGVRRKEDCDVCQKQKFEIMEGKEDIIVEETCEGYNVVPKNASVDLKKISSTYNGNYNELFTSFAFSGRDIILFENGRMQVNADNAKEARSIYSKIVGL